MMPGEITKQELIDGYKTSLTVGDLRDIIAKSGLPDTAKVLIQRVEDVYYEKHNWNVLYKEGEHTFKDDSGGVVKESLEQYHPASWCYSDDDMFFIDLHI